MVKGRRRTEAAEAPRRQASRRPQNTARYLRKKQRLPAGRLGALGCDAGLSPRAAVLALEELHRLLVLLSAAARLAKSAEVSPATRSWIDLSRVQAVMSRLQLPNHVSSSRREFQP